MINSSYNKLVREKKTQQGTYKNDYQKYENQKLRIKQIISLFCSPDFTTLLPGTWA